MKLLIAALLAVFSTSVMAEWTRVGNNDVGTTHYVDRPTIRKSGDKVKMWSLQDFKVAKIRKATGESFLSMAGQDEYDCKEDTIKMLTLNFYSKNMGAGEVVYSSGNLHEEFEPITPGSMGEILIKVACGK